jgi:YVTN family beta-propeller protein
MHAERTGHPAGARVLAAALLALAACSRGEPPGRERAVPPVSAVEPDAFVTDEDGGVLLGIDTRADSVVTRLEVGKRPRGVRVAADGRVYVAVSGSPKGGPGVDESTLPPPDTAADGLAVVERGGRRLLGTLPAGRDPESFDLDPRGTTAYLSNESTGEVSLVDLGSGAVRRTVSVGGEPEGVETSPDGAEVWVTSEEEGAVYVLDAATGDRVAVIPTGERPRTVAFLPDGSRAYVPGELDGTVSVVDARAHRVLRSIPIPGPGARPMGTALSADGRTLYVTTGRGGTVAVIDTGRDSVVATIEVGGRPWGLALTPDGRKLYTADGPTGRVSVIDPATRRVVGRIEVGGSPWGVAVRESPDSAPAAGARTP